MPKTKQLVSTTSIAVSPQLRDELKALAVGLGTGTTYNDVVCALLEMARKNGEDAYALGKRLRLQRPARPGDA